MELLVTFTSPDEGGRKYLPDLQSGMYRPHVVVNGRPEDEYLGVQFIGYSGTAGFGIEIPVMVLLPYVRVDYSPLEVGASFVINEGGRNVGCGRVAKL